MYSNRPTTAAQWEAMRAHTRAARRGWAAVGGLDTLATHRRKLLKHMLRYAWCCQLLPDLAGPCSHAPMGRLIMVAAVLLGCG